MGSRTPIADQAKINAHSLNVIFDESRKLDRFTGFETRRRQQQRIAKLLLDLDRRPSTAPRGTYGGD